jgi:signal transduction histidine kinase
MKKTGRQTLIETSVMTVKVILCILLVFNAFVFLYYGMPDRRNLVYQEPFRMMEDWKVTDCEGNEIDPKDHERKWKEKEQDFTIYANLFDRISDNEFLFFDTRKDAAVYINGELRKDFIEKRDVPIPGGSVKRFYMMVPLKASDSGAQIRIVLRSKLEGEQIVPETFISTRYGAFSYLMQKGGLSLFLSSIILIFSIAVIIISVGLHFWYKLKIDMLYGAIGIFAISSWLVTDSSLFPFVFGMNYVSGILNYMFSLMIPLAPGVYLNSVLRGRYKTSMSFAMLLTGLNAVIWPFLHFLGLLPFYHARNIVNFILALMAVYAIVLLSFDAVKGNAGEYRYTFTGFMGFLVCAIVELLILLIKPSDTSVPMVVGLGFLLTFIVIQQVDDLRKVNLERQHAINVSEAKTRFLASMSHEIRTPINAILGMNEMILRENTDKVIDEYAHSIKASGKMLLMLVNDVLDFSRIEAGKLEIIEARFRMSEMLRDVISLVSERADEKALEIKTEITDEIPDGVISDEFRIRQILVNLLNNGSSIRIKEKSH